MYSSKERKVYTISSTKNSHLNIKKIPKHAEEETLMQDLKRILQVSQICGLSPYTISNSNLELSKTGLIYSAIFLIFASYIFSGYTYLIMTSFLELKIKIIFITIVISALLCTIIELLICVFWDKKVQDFLNRIKYYDKSMNYKNATNILVKFNWAMLIILLIFITSITVVTYCLEFRFTEQTLAYSMFCSLLSLGVLKFLLFAMVIFARCRDLNLTLSKDIVSVDTESGFRKLNLENTWQHHESLTVAAKSLNALYSVQLLVWFTIFSMSSMFHIYELATNQLEEFFDNVRSIICTIYFILNLAALAVVCDITAYEVNKMGGILSSSTYFRQFNNINKQNILLFGQYFQFHTFYFSAGGLFKINFSILLSIASTMTTFLVILMSPNQR